jgi:hypothetical protein
MTKFEIYKKVYEDAVKSIQRFIDDPSDMNEFAAWLMDTDANPYSYLEQGYADLMSTAEGCAGLLETIHHAVYDDGDITFVTVDDQPRIVFAHRFDEGFRDVVLCRQEKEIEKRLIFGKTKSYKIEVLDIKPNDFPKIYNAYQLSELKRCFSYDAGRNGIDFAVEHYRKYACFSEDWVEICADEIAKWSKFYHGSKTQT